MPTEALNAQRRVVLLETDERAGLVASLAAACASQAVSLDIVTGPGHVLITFDTDDMILGRLLPVLQTVEGVVAATPYTVL
ncbi:MAG: hypothetical protein M3Y13_15445 [Armatimonadota bacterium]|nr:hypothetical protein [Armatimonadota bacterium]